MITTSQKPMCHRAILISKKIGSVNDEIDKLRHSATSALLERNDVIVVASVSCIYGLGSPKEYADSVVAYARVWRFLVINCSMTWVDIQFEAQ